MADSPFDQVEPIYIDIEFVVLIFSSRGVGGCWIGLALLQLQKRSRFP